MPTGGNTVTVTTTDPCSDDPQMCGLQGASGIGDTFSTFPGENILEDPSPYRGWRYRCHYLHNCTPPRPTHRRPPQTTQSPQTPGQPQFNAKEYQQCVSAFQNSTVGKVVKFGSLLSFLDDALGTAKVWGEAIVTKYSYFKIAEMAGQSLQTGTEITPVTTVVKPLVGDVATAGVALATVADVMARGTCSMAASPDLANAALRTIP